MGRERVRSGERVQDLRDVLRDSPAESLRKIAESLQTLLNILPHSRQEETSTGMGSVSFRDPRKISRGYMDLGNHDKPMDTVLTNIIFPAAQFHNDQVDRAPFSNVLVFGEVGTGKSSLADNLALELLRHQAYGPVDLDDKKRPLNRRILSIPAVLMMHEYVARSGRRMQELAEAVVRMNGVLIIENIHHVLGNYKGERNQADIELINNIVECGNNLQGQAGLIVTCDPQSRAILLQTYPEFAALFPHHMGLTPIKPDQAFSLARDMLRRLSVRKMAAGAERALRETITVLCNKKTGRNGHDIRECANLTAIHMAKKRLSGTDILRAARKGIQSPAMRRVTKVNARRTLQEEDVPRYNSAFGAFERRESAPTVSRPPRRTTRRSIRLVSTTTAPRRG